MTPEEKAVDRLARIETNIESMASTLKTIADDHEKRIRTLETGHASQNGVIKLIGWLGAPTTAALIVFLASKH